MRTHYDNWSLENIVGLIVSTAVVVVPTMGCGAALWYQAHALSEKRAALTEQCRAEAKADEAFQACLDDRQLDWIGTPAGAGTAARPPA